MPDVSETPPPSADAGAPHAGLLSASFLGLAFTQFLTAVNDNIFRWLVIGIGKDFTEPHDYGWVLMAGTACFVLPYLLLAAPAGYLADRFSKRSVIVGCKVAEIAIMGLGLLAIAQEDFNFLLVAVGLMGAQSALFAPSKLGSIPEMLAERHISAANGIFGLMTVIATLVGMVAGNVLSDATGHRGRDHLELSAAVLLGVAVAGLLVSLPIRRLAVANPQRKIPWLGPLQTLLDLRVLAQNPALLRVALGIVFFWSVGALGQLNIDQLAYEGGALREAAKVPLLVSLIVGVGIGSVLAGIWSGGRVELGILPLGAGGMALGGILLFTVPEQLFDDGHILTVACLWACFLLFGLGLSAGLFDVPLEAFMQHRSPVKQRGAILSAANFLTFSGILLSSGLFWVLRTPGEPGSLEQVPAVAAAELPAEQQTRLRETEEQFRQAWQGGERPDVQAYVDRLPEPLRRVGLAHLVWIEFQVRRERGEALLLDQEIQRFPEEQQRLVRDVFVESGRQPLFTSRQIFLLMGLGTLPIFFYIVWIVPQASTRFFVWLLSRLFYRIRVEGLENIPGERGAMLAPNHISWLDGVLVMLVCDRPIRMVVWAGNFQLPVIRWLAERWRAIMLVPKPKALARALKEAREALKQGELVCIFAEGGITRSGQVQGFRPGIMKVLAGSGAPVVPVYLDGLWGSIFSFERGRFFWKWPRKLPYPITIYFGKPLTEPRDAYQIRRAVQDLGAAAVEQRMQQKAQLTRDFVKRCKQRKWSVKVSDSMGTSMKGGDLLTRTLVLRRLLRREVLADDEQHVGVLLPPSVGGVLANTALALDHRISVNLNYTASAETINQCTEIAGVRHILTSRRVMSKLPDSVTKNLRGELVYLEDFRDKVTTLDKITSAVQGYVLPTAVVAAQLKLKEIQPDDVMTIIFTSGSTGAPKGVMLTQANVAHNVDAIDQVVHIRSSDILLGILPFFHSFGFTVTMWGVLGLDIQGIYHFNPLDGKQVGKLCREHKATLLLATPTFLRSYVRRCEKDDFASVDVVVTGAEKLPSDLADAFEQKFGVRPVEGYGTTELAPLVAVNVPPSRSTDNFQADSKEGTVGRTVPGVTAKVVGLEDGRELGVGEAGMLMIKGPNVMKGYMNRHEETSQVIRDGWYVTGDIAVIDEEGFIRITGRESRFSKIGGEMVPHLLIEEALSAQIRHDDEEDHDGVKLAVTAVPHPKKGERLVVLHTQLDKSPDELCRGLSEAGLPNLYIPTPDSFRKVESIPLLGSGKLDLKAIRQLARDEFGVSEE